MGMKTIQTEVIVRRDPGRGKSKEWENPSLFDEAVWCQLCELAFIHTLLIDKISEIIKKDPNLLSWILETQNVQEQNSTNLEDSTAVEAEAKQGWLPKGFVKKLCKSLSEQAPFKGMSGRFYSSVIERVEEIFKSWFESRQKLIRKIKGKRHHLVVVESDLELSEISNFSQLEIEEQAELVLTQIDAENDSKGENGNLFNNLYKRFDATKDLLDRRAIIHLLRNGGKARKQLRKPRKFKKEKKFRKFKKEKKPPELMTFAQYLEAKRIEIGRLEKQLLNQLPRARNLFPGSALEESLEDLIALPDSSLGKDKQYFFLILALLVQQSNPHKYFQFEKHLLRAMDLQWKKLDGLYRILLFSFVLHTTSTQKCLQLCHYLIRAITVEAEQVKSQFDDWYESITSKLEEFLRKPKSLPYPISFGYDDVRSWQINDSGKIFFKLNGWKDLIFEVRCHRRQLPLIKTFLKDWQTKKQPENEGKYSGSLMLLRSIELIWKLREPNEQRETPLCSKCELFQQASEPGFWNECNLAIHWAYDSDALTKQGLENVRQRKLQPQLKKLREKQKDLEGKQELLNSLEQKIPEAARNKDEIRKIESLKEAIQKRQADLAKPRPKLDCLRNSQAFDRPDLQCYEGIPNIFVGVLLDLKKHLVVTVVDAMRRKVLAIRNTRSISEEGHKLLQRYFRQRHEHSKQRQVDQKAHRYICQTESGLGQQVARLFAKGLVELAQQYKASTIVLPETDGWRDRLYSQLVARAEIKCNGCKKAMAQYTKAYGVKLHQWDYSRLSKAIVDRAAINGLRVMLQKVVFEEDAFQGAANLAIAAYDSLNLTEM